MLLLLVTLAAEGQLTNIRIGVDPGHGGTDSGAVGPTGLREKDVNLTTALALKKYLIADGSVVSITRDTDVTVSLDYRTSYLLSQGVQRVISVHHNAAADQQTDRTMDFVYCGYCSSPASDLATRIINRIATSAGLTKGPPASTNDVLCSSNTFSCGIAGVGQANLHMVRVPQLSGVPATLVEVSFITSATEEQKLSSADYLNSNGWSIYAGVADHYGVAPKPQGDSAPVISYFSVTPRTIAPGGYISSTITATDNNGSGLSQLELWRAPDNAGVPGTWSMVAYKPASGNGPFTVTIDNYPPSVGIFWFGAHAVNHAGKWSVEPNPPGPLQVTVGAGTIVVQATLNGNSYSGSLNYALGGAATATGSSVPATLSSMPIGGYTLYYNSGGPSQTSTPSIDPPSSQILTNGGTIAWTIRFASVPTISGVSPNSGPEGGGQVVTISGAYLANSSSVTFGGSPAAISGNSATSIIVTSPPHNSGVVSMVVTTPSGSASSANGYTYLAAPVISSLVPNTGTTAGGQSVTINGANLQNATSVSFGGAPAAVVTNNAASIRVMTPSHTQGVVNVVVTTGGGSTTSAAAYSYLSALPPPGSFSAAATSTSQVTIQWTAVFGATTYELFRSSANSGWSLITSTGNTAYPDGGLTANTTYLYKVRGVGSGLVSSFSTIDPATTIIFTDTDLSGVTIKATHIDELRIAVNAMRRAAGLSEVAFTDTSLVGNSVRSVHITDLRTALDEARAAIGQMAVNYSEPITGGNTVVRVVHIVEIRSGVQ
jgi:N-acetylmuramoyl-L-alanine amidase